jgi:hypothetical protein
MISTGVEIKEDFTHRKNPKSHSPQSLFKITGKFKAYSSRYLLDAYFWNT